MNRKRCRVKKSTLNKQSPIDTVNALLTSQKACPGQEPHYKSEFRLGLKRLQLEHGYNKTNYQITRTRITIIIDM